MIPKVSVIVPVYNDEKYLSKCLDSILLQNLHDIEVICVDDGSTDLSGVILDNYAKKDTRLKVIHKENAGYGVSMNVGISKSTGEYIGIVESDDYILPNMYETLYSKATNDNLDMIKSEAYLWLEKDNLLSRIHKNEMRPFFNRVLDELDKNLFFEFYMNIWTGIYKRDFVIENNIWFNETPGASYQDNGFWFLTCAYAKKAMWLNDAFYYYRQDNPNASVRDKGKIMAMKNEYENLEKILIERNMEEYLPYCYTYRLIRSQGTYFRIGDEYKIDYCMQLESDYRRFMGYIRNPEAYNIRLAELIRNPKKITKRIIEQKHNALELLSSSNRIVLYGASEFSERIFRGIYNEGFSDKVEAFVVSNTSKKKNLAERKIITFKEALQRYSDALYVISVRSGTRAYNEICDILREHNICNVLDGNILYDYFYYR